MNNLNNCTVTSEVIQITEGDALSTATIFIHPDEGYTVSAEDLTIAGNAGTANEYTVNLPGGISSITLSTQGLVEPTYVKASILFTVDYTPDSSESFDIDIDGGALLMVDNIDINVAIINPMVNYEVEDDVTPIVNGWDTVFTANTSIGIVKTTRPSTYLDSEINYFSGAIPVDTPTIIGYLTVNASPAYTDAGGGWVMSTQPYIHDMMASDKFNLVFSTFVLVGANITSLSYEVWFEDSTSHTPDYTMGSFGSDRSVVLGISPSELPALPGPSVDFLDNVPSNEIPITGSTTFDDSISIGIATTDNATFTVELVEEMVEGSDPATEPVGDIGIITIETTDGGDTYETTTGTGEGITSTTYLPETPGKYVLSNLSIPPLTPGSLDVKTYQLKVTATGTTTLSSQVGGTGDTSARNVVYTQRPSPHISTSSLAWGGHVDVTAGDITSVNADVTGGLNSSADDSNVNTFSLTSKPFSYTLDKSTGAFGITKQPIFSSEVAEDSSFTNSIPVSNGGNLVSMKDLVATLSNGNKTAVASGILEVDTFGLSSTDMVVDLSTIFNYTPSATYVQISSSAIYTVNSSFAWIDSNDITSTTNLSIAGVSGSTSNVSGSFEYSMTDDAAIPGRFAVDRQLLLSDFTVSSGTSAGTAMTLSATSAIINNATAGNTVTVTGTISVTQFSASDFSLQVDLSDIITFTRS